LGIKHSNLLWIVIVLSFLYQDAQAQNVQSLPGASVGSPQLPHPAAAPHIPNALPPMESIQITPPPRPEKESPQASSSTLPITIQKIQVLGTEQLNKEEIEAITTPFEKRSSTLNELQEGVVKAIAKLYEKKGYITTVVYIPPQKLENGTLTVQVEEGIVSEIEYEEGRFYKDVAVEPRINLEPGEPFNIKKLQASIRRINENPDLQIQATLKAGSEPGGTKVILRPAEDHSFLHVMPFFDNLGRHTVGNNRGGLMATANNVLGLADTAYGNLYWTGKSWGNVSGYEVPIPWKYGTKVGFNYAYNKFNFNRSGLDFQGSASLYTPYITQELRRTENSTWTAELGFGFKNAGLEVAGFEISQDRLRTLTPALNYTSSDRWGRTMVRHEIGIGLDLFNATRGDSPTTSRLGAGSQFWRYTAYAMRSQKLPWQTYGVFKIMGQATPNKLVSLEQFQIGGSSSVRGYQQGLLIGDSGFTGSVEWRIPLRFLPLPENLKLFKTYYNLKSGVEFVTFSDFGGVWGNGAYTSVNPQSNSITKKAFLGSVGAGLRLRLTRFISARLDLGVPYVRVVGDKTAAWLHFGLESNLF
jgi:hemolysin activation/secretion protein